MNVGRKLRERREYLGLTQEELAQVLGVTTQYISAIETNKKVPSLSVLARLAEALGVNVDYFVSSTEGTTRYTLGTIAAIKADSAMSPRAKKALVKLVQELHDLR